MTQDSILLDGQFLGAVVGALVSIIVWLMSYWSQNIRENRRYRRAKIQIRSSVSLFLDSLNAHCHTRENDIYSLTRQIGALLSQKDAKDQTDLDDVEQVRADIVLFCKKAKIDFVDELFLQGMRFGAFTDDQSKNFSALVRSVAAFNACVLALESITQDAPSFQVAERVLGDVSESLSKVRERITHHM